MSPEKMPSSDERPRLSREEKLARIKAAREADEVSKEATKSRGHMAASAAGIGSSAEDIHTETPVANAPEKDRSSIQAEVEGKAKKNSNVKTAITILATAAFLTAAGLIIPNVIENRTTAPQSAPMATEAVDESHDPNVGETVMGVKYDYSHYADFDHKQTPQSYDYDMSGAFGNREATKEGIMGVATREPEALSSYAYSIFTDKEKQELGIADMSMSEIDDHMSNETNPDAGAMQDRLLSKLDEVLSSDYTTFDYYYENDTEHSNYIYFIDDNNDGVMTPDELHLGYSTRERNGAPQVDIYRQFVDENGVTKNEKMLDLNYYCGFQPNYEMDNTPDVPYVPDTPTPTPT
ncbi:MAG: hypothetical protein Q4A70_01355, partial [Candidatus Saccharibacteria bacterium]|nr:hypothetical protein [Candidatus Saccharibacteria bacterium]